MAYVVLNLIEAKRGGLPLVCMRCGEVAFRSFPVPLGIGWRQVLVQLPFCEPHGTIILTRKRWRLTMLVGLVLAVAVMIPHAMILKMDSVGLESLILSWLLVVVAIIGWIIGVISWYLFFKVVRQSVSVRWYIRQGVVKLRKVAPAFVEALRLQRELESGVSIDTEPGLNSGRFPLQDDARQALQLSLQQARDLKHQHVGSMHLLFGLRMVNPGGAGVLLESAGVTVEQLLAELQTMPAASPPLPAEADLPITPLVRRVFERAAAGTRGLHHQRPGSEDILLALLREPEGASKSDAVRFLSSHGVGIAALLQKLREPSFGARNSGPD